MNGLILSIPKVRSKVEQKLSTDIEVQSNGCIEYTGCINNYGYGSIYLGVFEGKKIYRGAHVLAYLLYNGPIPDSLVIDHTCHDPQMCNKGRSCRHRRCVNSEHLQISTRGQNASRAHRAKTQQCKQGHIYSEGNDGWTTCGKDKKYKVRMCLVCARDRARKRRAH